MVKHTGPVNRRNTLVSRRASGNQLLRLLPRAAIDALQPCLELIDLRRGESLFEPDDEVPYAYLPLSGAIIALVLPMHDGSSVEAATIGREGIVGGIMSFGLHPAFARATVQVSGKANRISIAKLEAAKRSVPKLHDLLLRYADCLTAHILQSVACAAIHPLQARCARWLLITNDRLQVRDLPLTHESLAEMLGVARTYVTRTASDLQRKGAISYHRGVVHIENRHILEETTCECYWAVRRHYDRVLPGLYPTLER